MLVTASEICPICPSCTSLMLTEPLALVIALCLGAPATPRSSARDRTPSFARRFFTWHFTMADGIEHPLLRRGEHVIDRWPPTTGHSPSIGAPAATYPPPGG